MDVSGAQIPRGRAIARVVAGVADLGCTGRFHAQAPRGSKIGRGRRRAATTPKTFGAITEIKEVKSESVVAVNQAASGIQIITEVRTDDCPFCLLGLRLMFPAKAARFGCGFVLLTHRCRQCRQWHSHQNGRSHCCSPVAACDSAPQRHRFHRHHRLRLHPR
jgi:hypothetical protein